MLSTYEKSRKTFTLSLGILPKIPKCVPLFLKIFYSHQVYFQKNWKRSRFFHIFPEKVAQRVYCQKIRKCSRFFRTFSKICPSGIFPEFLKAFRFFGTIFKKTLLLHWWLSEKVPPKGHTPFQLFLENFYILTSHITDLEWFMCQFELKAPSEKVQSSPPLHCPPRIELASCIQYICEKSENAHLFLKNFQFFFSRMKIEPVYPH